MSRFVSAGTDEEPSERDEAWLKAQEDIEARLGEGANSGKQEGGKSLYETLQANKAAKQEAFEESARLKNQFRSLDDDEVEFLDSVLESTRAKEAEVKKETSQQLEAFRRQQEEAEKASNAEGTAEALDVDPWKAGPRKRKKGRESAIGGVKLRRTSTTENKVDKEDEALGNAGNVTSPTEVRVEEAQKSASPPLERQPHVNNQDQEQPALKTPSSPKTGLGLAAYSSDEDD